MSRTVLQIPANPEHVRTARLVASAAARQAELGEEVVEAISLATDEACTLALGEAADWNQTDSGSASSQTGDTASVDGRNLSITLLSDKASFVIEVSVANAESKTRYDEVAAADPDDDVEPLTDRELAMTVIRVVAPEVAVEESTLGFVIRMAWPK